MRRIVRAIYHTNGTYYHIGPAAVAICKYFLCPSMNITCDLVMGYGIQLEAESFSELY